MAIGQKLNEQARYVNMLAWGREGTGKTTAALVGTKLGKVLLINAEGGAKADALAQHGVDPSKVDVWPSDAQGAGHITYDTLLAEVVEPLRAELKRDPKAYSVVVMDSGTEIATLLLQDIVKKAKAQAEAKNRPRGEWNIEIGDYGVLGQQMRALLRHFHQLPIHFVMTALHKESRDPNTDAVEYGPALTGSVANDAAALMDLVLNYRIQDIGGEHFFVAGTQKTGAVRAKDRFGKLPPTLVNPTLNRIIAYLDGSLTPEKDGDRSALLKQLKSHQEAAQAKPAQPDN